MKTPKLPRAKRLTPYANGDSDWGQRRVEEAFAVDVAALVQSYKAGGENEKPKH